MNFKLRTAAAAMLSASLIASTGVAQEPAMPKKHVVVKKTAAGPSVEEQLQALRDELTKQAGQIDSLKSGLSEKDAQLKKAEQTAAEAQAAATKLEQAAQQQQQTVSDNAAAVSTLQTTVNDLKANSTSLATTISDEVAGVKKAVNNPSTLHYKGITLTPGGFIAAESVWRAKATGGDIPTAFSSIPYEGSDNYRLSEFFGSARQSRLSLLAEGKTEWGTLRGYYEADFLGTGITSNNNQSNSYVMRQRVLYAQAETKSRWTFVGGQLWSLAAEQKKGITSVPGDVTTPQTIDANYVPGFVWARQWGFRVAKNYNKYAFAVSAENPQLLYSASLAGNTPYAVLGSAGQNGGNYNAAVSASVPTTYLQKYTSQTEYDSNGYTTYVAVPVYNTIYANTNIANLSFNQAPDVIVKATADPGFGHYEVFGIVGFAHETIYPNVTTDALKYGGITDNVNTATNGATTLAVASASSANHFNNSIQLGGIGGSARVNLLTNKLTLGVKGLYGPGMGRYGNSTLSDVTANSWGGLSPIHNASGLITVEANPTPRLTIFANYGGDYASRVDYSTTATTTLGSPTAYFCPSTAGAFACTKTPTINNIAAGGSWGSHYVASQAAVGYGSRMLDNSSCVTLAKPGYSGSSTGYYSGGSCGANTRNVQEVTAGYWYDLYKGDKGRLRQAFQYGYAVREGWSGQANVTGITGGIGAKGIDNMFWTSFRYYLP